MEGGINIGVAGVHTWRGDHGGVAGVDTWRGGWTMEGGINIGVAGVDTWGGGPWRDGLT